MRWGEGEARWVRPLESILCLLDGAVVPFAFAGIESGAETVGHRFMAPARLAVRGFDDYRTKLRDARVVLDGEERKRLIRERSRELASAQGLRLREDEGLLDELKGLVEWPVPLLGRIEPSFMELPPEVLVTSMRTHQRYLALEDGEGRLAPFFVSVANIAADDGGAAIVQGNERVLRARLWDARFFWEQDRKRPLEAGLAKLETVVFHAELGTQGERVRRLVQLSTILPRLLKRQGVSRQLEELGTHPEYRNAKRAALLSKADLASATVAEFPELQGVVGSRIAEAQGEINAVVIAIRQQYNPRGQNDNIIPSTAESVIVAIADRLDTLVGLFAIGIEPSGSRDPFALRRAAYGLLYIILRNQLRGSLDSLISAAFDAYGARADQWNRTLTAERLRKFLVERVRQVLTSFVTHDMFRAAFACEQDDLQLAFSRALDLQGLMLGPDGRNLLAGYRRASSIVAIETKRDARSYDEPPDLSLLREPAERALFEALESAQAAIKHELAYEDFAAAMRALARLRVPIDAFFDSVMVNAPETELRANRLRMLNRVRGALGAIADFSLIEDTGSPA